IRGVEGGGLVEGLPTWLRVSEDEGKVRSAVEISISDRQEKQIADLGFVPLVACKGTDFAAFFSVQSCCRPRLYANGEASAISRLSRQLPYILTSSRFIHYMKVIALTRLGSFHSRGDWEKYLNAWISQYVFLDDAASPSLRAQFPLREAMIDV